MLFFSGIKNKIKTPNNGINIKIEIIELNIFKNFINNNQTQTTLHLIYGKQSKQINKPTVTITQPKENGKKIFHPILIS